MTDRQMCMVCGGEWTDELPCICKEEPTLLDSALEALWLIADSIPEMWGDYTKDGYVMLHVPADTIHEIERVLYVSEVD